MLVALTLSGSTGSVSNITSSGQIRQWLRNGDIPALEQLVLNGEGSRLVGEYSPDARTRAYLKQIPSFQSRAHKLHDVVRGGYLTELQVVDFCTTYILINYN